MTTSKDAKTQQPTHRSNAGIDDHSHVDKQVSSLPNNQRPLFVTHTATVVVALIALGCAIYAMYTNAQLQRGTKQQVGVLLAQINTLKQQQTDTGDHVDTSIKSIHESQDSLLIKLKLLDKSLHFALQQRLYQAKDWLLLKARYCLELAQINAHWSDNSETTIGLLQQADAMLADVHDQHLFAIRQAIAKEIAQVQAIQKLDMAGMLSQLDAAQSVIANLPLKPSVAPVDKNKVGTVGNDTSSAWRERLKGSVALLEKLVVVRRHDEDILPLPSPEYEAILRESICLNLQEAQWAVLQNNDFVFQFSLAHAIKNIKRLLSPDTAATKTVIQQLLVLQKIHLTQQKPDLEQSLPLLNQLIESKDSQLPPLAAGDHS